MVPCLSRSLKWTHGLRNYQKTNWSYLTANDRLNKKAPVWRRSFTTHTDLATTT